MNCIKYQQNTERYSRRFNVIFSKYSTNYKKSPKFIDLFCGAGGLSLGCAQAGGIPVAALDSDEDSIKTYQNMFSVCQDVQCAKIEEWKMKANPQDIDIVIGGPPCQGFSLARGKRFVDDPRNSLYKYFVTTVAHVQPKWFVMENVPGIISIGDGVILEQIYQDFEAIGYKLTHKVINMAEYGVPQARKRTIFVGNNLGKNFCWPQPEYIAMPKGATKWNENYFRTVKMALNDLPWPMGNYFSHRANSKMRGPRNRDVNTQPAFTLRVRGDEFALCEFPAPGAFSPGLCPEIELKYYPCENDFQGSMREQPPRWLKNYTAPALLPNDNRETLHGTRRLSIREQARLQTFPDWFEFSGRPYSQSRQIGNAVPPLFARILFTKIIEQL